MKKKRYATNCMVFRITPKMYADVTAIAEDQFISASAVCRQALAAYLKNINAESNIFAMKETNSG